MTTSIPELMQSLNHLVAQRKVLYLGVSDTPASVSSNSVMRIILTKAAGGSSSRPIATLESTASANSSYIKGAGVQQSETSNARSFPCASMKAWVWPLGVPWVEVRLTFCSLVVNNTDQSQDTSNLPTRARSRAAVPCPLPPAKKAQSPSR